jgi:ATP-dependent Zn protease
MPRGHALGMVSYLPEADKYDMTREVRVEGHRTWQL